MSISPVTVALAALLVSALALTWNVVSWRRSGPEIRLETFSAVFHPENELPEDAEDTSFQVINVINSGRAPADIVAWGVRFLARPMWRCRGSRSKIVDFTGELPAPSHLPIRVEPSSEVRVHAFPLRRFVRFIDATGRGQSACRFQFDVRISGQGEVSTKLVDVPKYLFAWDGRGNPPNASLRLRLQFLWARLVVRFGRTRMDRP
jgi:hypothetical protein